ncbi:uncharacterized protein LOC129976111 isoform X2 [Argiope bruennichi]|uniref:uncharacterized protein LOC129976111 isoform X2 n=1 Tax=Argiope bruennichi TaxID=94029 RepID=UPI002494BB3C|nr:uncharacterized protein LOC129976111 isoform X2 [Argiope bruennichi]
MTEKCPLPLLRKGKRVVLKWVIHHFFPQSFGNLNYNYFESCPFPVEEMVFKMCLIPWYEECPGKVACLLIRDNIAPRFVHYLVDSEVTIDNKIWRQPETEYRFDIQEPKYVPLMHLSDLKDQNAYAEEKL